jgi:hypothetical protein
MSTDLIDALSAAAPRAEVLEAEWPSTARQALLARIMSDELSSPPRVRPLASRRRALLAPLATSAAVLAAVAGATALVRSDDAGHGVAGGFDPGPLTATQRVLAGQYTYRADTTYKVAADGDAKVIERSEDWTAPDGENWSRRVDGARSYCFDFPRQGAASIHSPTQAVFDSLPTEPDALNSYLREHAEGSTSRDEAVFVAVGDMLRTEDGLASSALRAALVEVLAGTGRVTVHPGAHDFLGRPAVRADFVDQQNRPGELASLYFDPATYQLLEERYGSSGGSTVPPAGPSQPYDATPAPEPGTGPDLSGAATARVMTAERVVDTLPDDVQRCPRS